MTPDATTDGSTVGDLSASTLDAAATGTPSALVVVRWAKYGHDRLYVQTADGTRLGFWDNKTATAVLEVGTDIEAFHDALNAHRDELTATPVRPPRSTRSSSLPLPPVATVPLPAVALPPAPLPAPLPAGTVTVEALPCIEPEVDAEVAAEVEPEPTWADLSATKAGAAAREQAIALKQAAPVRTFLARAFGVKNDERAWRIGADGEEAVAACLSKLDQRWKVLHAVPVGENGSDIDHVVLGPGGVFTINAKNHPDAAVWVGGNVVMVGGFKTQYVRNARFEAKRTSKFLSMALGGIPVPTIAVIAIVGARGGFTVKSQPPGDDVFIIGRSKVTSWFSKRPEVLTDVQIEALYAVARRSDTWLKK